MTTEPRNGAPQRDMSISRTEDEAQRTQECMNSLAPDLLAERRARKAAEKAAAEAAKENQ